MSLGQGCNNHPLISGKGALTSKPLKNLSDDLTTDKIAAIRAKLLSNRRTRCVDTVRGCFEVAK